MSLIVVLAVLSFVVVFSGVALLLSVTMKGSARTDVEKSPEQSASLNWTRITETRTQLADSDETALHDSGDDLQKRVVFSAIPWLNRKMQELELAARMRMLLYQANMSWTPAKFLLLSVAMSSACMMLIATRTSNLLLILLPSLAVACVPFAYVLWKRHVRFIQFETGMPEALDQIVSALRAGHSLNAALGLIARECSPPISTEFQICFAEQNYGLELREALENLVTRMPIDDLQIAVTAVLIQKETGGNLAEVLDKTSEVIRERFRLRRQVRVHTAHGRMTGLVISVLPFVLFCVLLVLNPKREGLLWSSDLGRKMIMASLVSMGIGTALVQKIIRVEV